MCVLVSGIVPWAITGDVHSKSNATGVTVECEHVYGIYGYLPKDEDEDEPVPESR